MIGRKSPGGTKPRFRMLPNDSRPRRRPPHRSSCSTLAGNLTTLKLIVHPRGSVEYVDTLALRVLTDFVVDGRPSKTGVNGSCPSALATYIRLVGIRIELVSASDTVLRVERDPDMAGYFVTLRALRDRASRRKKQPLNDGSPMLKFISKSPSTATNSYTADA